jgi:hypothetical protein
LKSGYDAIQLGDDFIIFDATKIKSINNIGTWMVQLKYKK